MITSIKDYDKNDKHKDNRDMNKVNIEYLHIFMAVN